MKSVAYPHIFEGDWIWKSNGSSKCILTHEFYLTQIPSSADFWFAAGEFAHIYVNGMHLTFGPHAGSHDKYSLNHLDITFLLNSGKNTITVLASAPGYSLYSRPKMPKGFWAQILIDGVKNISTSSEWNASSASFISESSPRRSAGCLPVQSFDISKNSISDYFNKVDDCTPAQVIKKATSDHFTPYSTSLRESTSSSFPQIRALGAYDQVLATMHVDFTPIYTNPGAYVATSYFHVNEETKTEILTFSDSAFKIFVNGFLINEQGSQTFINDADPNWHSEMSAMERGDLQPMCAATLKAGWNSIRVISYCDQHSRLLALNFINLGTEEAIPHIQRSNESDEGYLLAGPLNIPFTNLAGSLNINLLNFTAVAHNRHADASIFLQSCSFKAEAFNQEGGNTITLSPQQFLCYDLGEIRSGCVRISVDTPQETIIFVVYGESFNDGIPRSLHTLHGRRALKIKLKEGDNNWEDFFPVGMRYVFVLSAGHCEININDVQLLALQKSDSTASKFECPNMKINNIWQRSLSTLNSCSEYGFMDSPSGRRAQFLRDAALQSIYAMTANGKYEQSRQALIEFSRGQYETGELPSVYPSSYYYSVGESSMYWAIWLQQYLLHTNDMETAEILLSTLKELCNFYTFYENEQELLSGSIAVLSSQIPDDAPLDAATIFTSVNAIYLRMLSSTSWIYTYLDLEDEAESCRNKMLRISKHLRSHCWNPERNLFADWSLKGQQSSTYSAESNFFAMNAGIIPSSSINQFLAAATLNVAPFTPLAFMHEKSPFLYDVLIQAATNINLRSWAFDIINYYWGAMVDQELSTWPEFFDPDSPFSKENTSLCHGIGCGPAQFFVNEIAGVRPAAPGFDQIYFSPLTEKMEWARARINTIQGTIKVEWMKNSEGGLDVSIESSYELELIPQLKREIAEKSSFHLSENIGVIGR